MTEKELTHELIYGILDMVKTQIRAIVTIEGEIRSINIIGNSYYITFANGNRYIQPFISKNTGTINED